MHLFVCIIYVYFEMESEVVFQHYLIVHVNTFKTQLSVTANEQVGILELTALKINSDGIKIESLFHDYGKLSYCRKGISCNPKMYIPDITAVCNHANDVLEGFKIWIHMHSLETVNTPSKDNICDVNGSLLLPVDVRAVDSSTDIKNVMWPNKQLKNFLIVTWGNWHFQEFLQDSDDSTQIPDYCQTWCNAKQIYVNFLKMLPSDTSLSSAMARLGVRCVTDESSGIYNCINIAKIIASLMDSGAKLQVNERLHPESSDVKNKNSICASGSSVTFDSAKNKMVPPTAESSSEDIPPKKLPEDAYLISSSMPLPSLNSTIAASAQSVPYVDRDSSSCRISESSLSLENGVFNSSVYSKERSLPSPCLSNIAGPAVSILTSKQLYHYMPSETALKQSAMLVHQNQLRLPHIYSVCHGMPSLPLGIPFYTGQQQMLNPMLKSNYSPVLATYFTRPLIANSYSHYQFQNQYLPLLQPRQQCYPEQQSLYESSDLVGQNNQSSMSLRQNTLENAQKICAAQDINIENDPINDIGIDTNHLYPNLSTVSPTVSSVVSSVNVILESDKMLSSINTSRDTKSSLISNTSLKHDPVFKRSVSHGGEQLSSNFSFGSLDYTHYQSNSSTDHESGKRASAESQGSSLQTDFGGCSLTNVVPGVQFLSNVENFIKEHLVEDCLDKPRECNLQSSVDGYSSFFRHLQSSEQHIPGASLKEDKISEKKIDCQSIPVHMIQKPSLIKDKKQTIITEPMSYFQQTLSSEQQMEKVSLSIEANNSMTLESKSIPHPSIPGLFIPNPRFTQNVKKKKTK